MGGWRVVRRGGGGWGGGKEKARKGWSEKWENHKEDYSVLLLCLAPTAEPF